VCVRTVGMRCTDGIDPTAEPTYWTMLSVTHPPGPRSFTRACAGARSGGARRRPCRRRHGRWGRGRCGRSGRRPCESSDEQSTTTFTYSVVRSPGRTTLATATASCADRQFNRASPILVVWVGRVKRGFSAAMGCSSRFSSYFCAGADARVAGRGRLGGRRRKQARRRASSSMAAYRKVPWRPRTTGRRACRLRNLELYRSAGF
jgi:hypothetical protein